jgi:hypothetical protein
VTIELSGRKVVVTGGKLEFDRTIAETVADVVIWIREWKGDANELKRLLPKIEAQRWRHSRPMEHRRRPHSGASQWRYIDLTGSAAPALRVHIGNRQDFGNKIAPNG